jgi:pimeloyl-ACP methyl ester carboxylesterase
MSVEMKDSQPSPETKRSFLLRGLCGAALIVAGLLMVLPHHRNERTYLIDAGGCYLQTTVYGTAAGAEGTERGTVVLFPGLAANRKIMSYLADGFALEGLHVFVPDLPGHGRTEGPFSPARAEECAENLIHELRSRGLAPPDRTILAGHSMGGAIAIRVAARVPVAGVIAISPAPMRTAHRVSADALLFDSPPALPPNTEVINGSLEPELMTANARDLLQPGRDVNSHYDLIPWGTHAGLLWRPDTVRLEQDWAEKVLRLDAQNSPGTSVGTTSPSSSSNIYKLPSRLRLAGCLLGLMGFFLIAGPFLREAASIKAAGKGEIVPDAEARAVPMWRAALELFAVGSLVVVLLRYWMPLRLVRLFEGDYLAGFLLFVGIVLIAAHWKQFVPIFSFRSSAALGAVFAAVVLFLLFTAWFELSITEAWLDAARWQRFPLLFIALIPCLTAEEILLGPPQPKNAWKRVTVAMFYRLLLWLTLLLGILLLHSGEILLVLLAPYFLALSVAQRRGMDVVREVTGSPAAAALFGAILLTGFCLVIFPLL